MYVLNVSEMLFHSHTFLQLLEVCLHCLRPLSALRKPTQTKDILSNQRHSFPLFYNGIDFMQDIYIF